MRSFLLALLLCAMIIVAGVGGNGSAQTTTPDKLNNAQVEKVTSTSPAGPNAQLAAEEKKEPKSEEKEKITPPKPAPAEDKPQDQNKETNSLLQQLITLLNQGDYEGAHKFAKQNAKQIHPVYGPELSKHCAEFLKAQKLAARGKTKEAEKIVRSLESVRCCVNDWLYKKAVEVFMQKLNSGAFKEAVPDKKNKPAKK